MSWISKTVTLYAQAGATWTFPITLRNKKTCVPVDLTGLKGRGQVRKPDGTLVLDIDNTHFAIDVPTGVVTVTVAASDTADFVQNNERTELVHGFELYDDSGSPEIVKPLLDGPLIVKPAVILP